MADDQMTWKRFLAGHHQTPTPSAEDIEALARLMAVVECKESDWPHFAESARGALTGEYHFSYVPGMIMKAPR